MVTGNAMNDVISAKQNRVNKKQAGGAPKFEPTDEQRKTVEGGWIRLAAG